jgi:hypothetical protein
VSRAEFIAARREARKVLKLAVCYLRATDRHLDSLVSACDVRIYVSAGPACGDELSLFRLSTRLRWHREGRRIRFSGPLGVLP